MLESIVKTLIIALFASFPILLWGYGTTFLSHHVWNRARFFSWLVGGWAAVVLILFFERYLSGDMLSRFFAVDAVFIILSGLVYLLTSLGSPYIRGFLRRVALLHALIFTFLLAVSYGLERCIGWNVANIALFASMGSYILLASLEEWVKHLSTVGLTAREFRFSRTDFLLFTFFISLGFVFTENILYFVKAWESSLGNIVSLGIGRTLFATTIHIFASAICVMCWWRGLSYGVFSLRYILWIILGFTISTLIHALYNSLMADGHIIAVIGLFLLGYFAFTQWLISEK